MTHDIRQGYRFYWLREIATGRLSGEFGLAVNPGGLERAILGDHDQPRPELALFGRRLEARSLAGECVEVHMPYLDRRQWNNRCDLLPRAEICVTDDRRLFVHIPGALTADEQRSRYLSRLALTSTMLAGGRAEFDLAFNNRQTLSRLRAATVLAPMLERIGVPSLAPDAWPEDGEVSVTLSSPANLVSAWLNAPAEGDPEYVRAFAAVSVAVQRALRWWIPYMYFSDLERYGDPATAWPLIVYQCARPYVGHGRSQFTYDVIDPENANLATVSTMRRLMPELARIRRLLIDAGKKDLTRFYWADEAAQVIEAVQRRPHFLNSMLSADSALVDDLVRLGARTRSVGDTFATDPCKATKDLTAYSTEFLGAFHRRLRHLYDGQSYSGLPVLLLMEATRALNKALGREAPVSGLLRVDAGTLKFSGEKPMDTM